MNGVTRMFRLTLGLVMASISMMIAPGFWLELPQQNTDEFKTSQPMAGLYHEWYELISVVRKLNVRGAAVDKETDDLWYTTNPIYPTYPLRKKVLPFVKNRTCAVEGGESSEEISLVTHLGANKLERLKIQAQRWRGPLSVAVYITGTEDIYQLISFWEENINDKSLGLCFMSIHVVMESVDPKVSDNTTSSFGYPHNVLRDVALHNVDTPYFVTLDADFVTLPDGHEKMKTSIQANDGEIQRAMQENKTLFILPAFNFATNDILSLPETRDSVISMIPVDYETTKLTQMMKRSHTFMYPFQMDVFPDGHSLTDIKRWIGLNQSDPNDTWYKTEYEFRSEPYVVGFMDHDSVRHYHGRFRGFGHDKISWILEMHCQGYQFGVMRDSAVFHLHHDPNYGMANKFGTGNKIMFQNFQHHLQRTYPICSTICENIAFGWC